MSEPKLNPETRSAGPAVGHPRVGEPYTPALLEKMKLMNTVPPVPDTFSPDGPWRMEYRVWSSQGWIDFNNRNIGRIVLEKQISASDPTFTLSVRQDIVHFGGILHTISARAICNNDAIASLREWSVKSVITDTSGTEDPRLTLEHSYRLEHGTVRRRINGSESSFEAGLHVSSDWSMLEAVQRLPFHEPDIPPFLSMDGMTVPKRGHEIHFRENVVEKLKNQNVTLRTFYQLGFGVLPYEYWLDENHRLIMMISMNRIYFLDNNAEKILNDTIQSLRGGGNYSGYPLS